MPYIHEMSNDEFIALLRQRDEQRSLVLNLRQELADEERRLAELERKIEREQES